MLNLLLVTLGAAWLTDRAGLSMALGAFVAGMLISETEYRHQVEEDIKPFRDVLLGLFFITVGMLLNLKLVFSNAGIVLFLFVVPLLLKFVLIALGIVVAVFAGLIAIGLLVEDNLNPISGAGWTVKNGEGQTLYAVVAPNSATLNVKAVVLACEVVNGGRGLHFQLYPATPGPLLPNGATREQLKENPAVRLEIDGAVVPAQLDFAGDFAVVYNQVAGGLPTITPALGNALERGGNLTLRFDLVRERAGSQPFDAYAIVDLRSNGGASAIAAVRRRCGQ